MKKLTTLLIICCMALMLTFGLTACGDKTCDHIYDHACDAICNECGEERTITHDWNAADCDTPKTCKVCGATEGEKLGHNWTTPDVDLCEVQSTCSRCGATDGENVEHDWTAADCESARSCSVCGVTDGEKLGHTPDADDGNCLTAITCQRCPEVLTAARSEHEANADDGDCTTAVTCKHCTTVVTAARTAHEASEDDGDCTTDIICKHCEQVAVEGNENHSSNADDNDCETPIVCSVCGKTTAEAKEHDFTGEWQKVADGHYHICKNDGCTVEDTKVGHHSGEVTCVGTYCEICKYKIGTVTNPENHAFFTVDDNGKCACGVSFVAAVGKTVYSSFEDAVSNWTDGTTLTLFADVTGTKSIEISGKSVTFDMNGHTYSRNYCLFTVKEDGSLVITDSSSEGDGLLEFTGRYDYAVFNKGSLTFAGGKVTSPEQYNSTIYISAGTFQMTGGIVECTGDAPALDINSYDGSVTSVLISGGTFSGKTDDICVYDSPVTISGTVYFDSIMIDSGYFDTYQSVVNFKDAKNADGWKIRSEYCPLTVGTQLILPDNMELQVDTLPVTVLNPGYIGVISHSHSGGNATCGAQAICDICSKPYGTTPAHSFDETGKCSGCGQQATISVTDGTNTYYALDAVSLNTAVTDLLNTGARTFTVNLPATAEAKLFTAIRRALIDTEGVADGSINLTLAGVTAIPDHDVQFPPTAIFGDLWMTEAEIVTQLAAINLPDVLTIGDYAFMGCENLLSLTAPKVQTVGDWAFAYTGITELELPEATTLGWVAFCPCENLISVKLPKAVSLGQQAFDNCKSLTKVELTTEGDITFSKDVFENAGNIDLVLNCSKASEITDDVTWNGYTFKSITLNHDGELEYKDNGDGTHTKTHECGITVVEAENHTIENHVCTSCGAMEIVVSFDADDYEWKTGDELYFCRVSRDNQWEEYCFTATVAEDGTVTWTPDKTLYWDGTGEHRLIVSYPANMGLGWDDFAIPGDQSTPELLREADHMNARWVGTPTTNVIEFELKHRMAKITVNYTIASQFDPDAPVIAEIYSNAMYCIFKDADGLPIITSVGRYDAWIIPYHNDNQFTAYVAPGEYNTDGMFKFYIGDAEVQIKIANPGAVTLEEGGEYTFDVKVGQDVLTIVEVSMGDIDSPFGDGWHNEIELRAIGTQAEGKTAWEVGDQIIVTFISPSFGTQYGTLTYDGTVWSTDVSFSYLEDETPTVSAMYAPCYDVVDGNIQLKYGMQLGMTEYILAACSVTDGILNISFDGAIRNYSRLRIFALPGQTLTVTTTDFTPAGATKAATEAYTLTADENGNVYLYGTFVEGATINVTQGEVTLADYTFTADKNPNGTVHNKSYALDARPIIDGTLGGKTTATEDDVNALVEQLKAYVDNGITTIIVPGTDHAMYDSVMGTIPAYAEALYLLADGNDQSPYCGTIDLILPDATEIVDHAFDNAFALKSITLPKVTTVGDGAFYGCTYLRTMTFGSVVTTIIQNERVVFYYVGEEVGGCDLVLNCGQMNSTYIPDLTANTWYDDNNKYFKSITLTHTGKCDECNAAQ